MYTDFYVGDADASDPLCSPAFAKDEALAVFPDCLIISAGKTALEMRQKHLECVWQKQGLCDYAANYRSYAWIYYKSDIRLGTGTGSSVQIFSGAFKIEQMSEEKILYEE